jgi:eukaryotic-like serine/threonine-protein kinase
MLELAPHLPDLIEGGRRYVQIACPQALVRNDRGRLELDGR